MIIMVTGMGQLEKESAQRGKKKNLQRLILHTVAAAGIIGIGLLAPNVLGTMAKLNLLPTKRSKDSIAASRNLLMKKGWLTKDTRGMIRITAEGARALEKIQTEIHGLPSPKRWDGKWRLLIFDIPQHRGTLRNTLRNSLRAVGFIQLQRSVWVYPHNCEDFVALLKADFKIGKDMRYIIADSIEGDTEHRKRFGLPVR